MKANEVSFIDTHCHLQLEPLSNSIANLIIVAKSQGVSKFIIPGVDLKSSKLAQKASHDFPECFCAIGVHPLEISIYFKNNELTEEKIDSIIFELNQMLENDRQIIAIGEIGLDYYYFEKEGFSDIAISTIKNFQKRLFLAQIALAKTYDLPIIIHSRNAVDDTISVLTEDSIVRAVLHCCEANDRLLEFATSNNVYIGVDGDVTFSKKKKQFVKRIPLDLLLLETDSPYLTPIPVKNTTPFPNNPSNLIYTAQKIAELLGIHLPLLAHQTTTNAQKLFGNMLK